MSTAFSNTTIEELGGVCVSGMRAVKITACGTSGRPVIDTRRLLIDDAAGEKGAPSSVIEYEARVAFP